MKIINTVQTICPQCHKVIVGHYIAKDNQVFLIKTCPDHGDFSTFVAPSVSEYLRWISTPTINIGPKSPELIGANEKEEGSQCPLHCGLCHNHLQTPCCVLIEITQRCNQHCPYCFACSDSNDHDPLEAALTLTVIGKKLDHLLELGEERPFNIQFSGGEPTIRDDLPEILELARSKGFPYLQVNTNGKRLAQEPGYAKKLKDAGASVIFLQFDGTNDKVYRELRNEDLWEIKQQVIAACREAQLPVTLVPTLVKNINMDQIPPMLEFLWNNLDIVTGIHFQPVSFFGRFPGELRIQSQENKVTLFELLTEIEVASKGLIKAKELAPMNTGHTLCGFHGTFLREEDGSISLLKESEELKDFKDFEELKDKGEPKGFDNINGLKNPQESAIVEACCCSKDPLETIKSDRGFVLNKWGGKGQGQGQGQIHGETSTTAENGFTTAENVFTLEPHINEGPMGFDEFLGYMRRRMFTISAMAFQDLMSLDGERLKRCRVHVLAQDDRVIPFCSYNTLYREEDLKKARCPR